MDTEKIEALNSLVEYLKALIPGIEKNVNSLRQGSTAENLKALADITEGLEWTIDALELCKTELKEPIDTAVVNEHVKEMLFAMENLDYILLADILEYEILPILTVWKEKIDY